VATLELRTDGNIADPLAALFRQRARGGGR
jgi:hypothetical protein